MEVVEYGTYVWVNFRWMEREDVRGGREGRKEGQVNELQEWCPTLGKRRLGDDGVDGQSENEIADEKGRLV